jgi:hypothetical protein
MKGQATVPCSCCGKTSNGFTHVELSYKHKELSPSMPIIERREIGRVPFLRIATCNDCMLMRSRLRIPLKEVRSRLLYASRASAPWLMHTDRGLRDATRNEGR